MTKSVIRDLSITSLSSIPVPAASLNGDQVSDQVVGAGVLRLRLGSTSALRDQRQTLLP